MKDEPTSSLNPRPEPAFAYTRLLQEEGLEGWLPGKPEEGESWTREGDTIIGEDTEGEAVHPRHLAFDLIAQTME